MYSHSNLNDSLNGSAEVEVAEIDSLYLNVSHTRRFIRSLVQKTC